MVSIVAGCRSFTVVQEGTNTVPYVDATTVMVDTAVPDIDPVFFHFIVVVGVVKDVFKTVPIRNPVLG